MVSRTISWCRIQCTKALGVSLHISRFDIHTSKLQIVSKARYMIYVNYITRLMVPYICYETMHASIRVAKVSHSLYETITYFERHQLVLHIFSGTINGFVQLSEGSADILRNFCQFHIVSKSSGETLRNHSQLFKSSNRSGHIPRN